MRWRSFLVQIERPSRSILNNHIYKFEGVVIGGNTDAVRYSYENKYPLILNHLEKSHPFDLVEGHQSSTALRDKLLADLSLRGLNMFADKISNVRIEENNLVKVVTQNSRVFRVQYDKLYVFDDQNVEGMQASYQKDTLGYKVLDWYDIPSCAPHDIKKLTSDEDFVREVHFINDEEYLKDRNLVAISYFGPEGIKESEALEIYVRYKVLDMMKEAGIQGRKNGINKETGEHYRISIKLAYDRREIIETKDLIPDEYDDIIINPYG